MAARLPSVIRWAHQERESRPIDCMRSRERAGVTDWGPPASAAARASLSFWNPFNRTARRAELEGKMKRPVRSFAVAMAASVVAACASVGGGPGGTVTNGGGVSTPGPSVNQAGIIWPVQTPGHVDLLLHGYASLHEDSTVVPVL